MGKDTTNTRVLSKVLFLSSLHYLQDIGVHKVRRSFVALDQFHYLINLTSCCILEEKRIWFCFALCSRDIFSLRIALFVPQRWLFLLLTSFIFFIYYLLLL